MDIESQIREALDSYVAKGGKLTSGMWGTLFDPMSSSWFVVKKDEGCCALSTLLLSKQLLPINIYTPSHTGTIADFLGVTIQWVDSFIAGWDSAGESVDNQAFRLGRDLYREYDRGGHMYRCEMP